MVVEKLFFECENKSVIAGKKQRAMPSIAESNLFGAK